MSDLTKDEQKNVRTALKFLHSRCREWSVLAKGLNCDKHALSAVAGGRKMVSARMAIRVARLAGVGIDALLAGNYPAPGTCPYCGHCPESSDKTI